MFSEEKLLDPALPGDKLLRDSLLMAQRLSRPQRQNDPCRRHQERESLIWAYADGFLHEEGEERAWEEISECSSCLNRLATVQRGLHGAEMWIGPELVLASEKQEALEPRPASIPQAASIPITERILSLFNFEWAGEVIQKVGEALTVGQFEPVRLMGEVKLTPWKGELAQRWNDLHVTITTEMGLGSENQLHDIAVSVEIRQQAKPPLKPVMVEFGDVYGEVMQTKHTDDKGQTHFSSKEGQRFKTSKNEIGFCLELVRDAKTVKWIVRESEMQDMTTTSSILRTAS